MSNYKSTFAYKLIYIFRINDEAHKGFLKIGEATCKTNTDYENLSPNCKELNLAAKERINSYTSTAGIKYELLHTEIATRIEIKNSKECLKAFSDHDVHDVLIRSGIKRHYFDTFKKQNEWFETDLETAKNAIAATKACKASLMASEISTENSPVIFRPEQEDAISKTVKQFKKSNKMLWNAKMRFGKTLTALQVAKECGFKKTIIITHRPAVSEGWFEDFSKIFYDTKYKFGSKTKGETIDSLVDYTDGFVYFASIQDLRGSESVGGKFDKNDKLLFLDWDYVVIDEAHEGTQTDLGKAVVDLICASDPAPKVLELSGTPFNLFDQFEDSEIYTWDYIMEQKAKMEWNLTHFGDSNPYASLPRLQIFTYNLGDVIPNYIDLEDSAFNFREFFRTWTGDIKKDFKQLPDNAKVGDFVHEDDVKEFLNLMCKCDDNSNYPFSKDEYRDYFRHSLWMVPGVKEAKALSALMIQHPVFCHFNVVNVAGDGDEEIRATEALTAVKTAFGDDPSQTYTITLSCGRLTTGVSIPEWTAVFMLAGTFSTSASSYLQTIFRVQTPANINGQVKDECYVFDFAPDRTLKMVAQAGQLSIKAGASTDRSIMGEFLNFCPVISINGSEMSTYDVDTMLQQLKKAYTDRVVRNGFDDVKIYNDELLKLDDIDLEEFEKLKKIIGESKQSKKTDDIDVNKQGLTGEEYEEIEKLKKKIKKELTEEDKAKLAKLKEAADNRKKAISILRGISIRIPLLIYGADVPFDEEITIDNFTDLIDENSWKEFMPNGVDKATFNKFKKYYDTDIFIAAGRQIRNRAKQADSLYPIERVQKIAEIFSTFKNPDKETVLTPWRVVNLHLGSVLGGCNFFNETYSGLLDEPRWIDTELSDVFSDNYSKILEINSKTGLYPLYLACSYFTNRIQVYEEDELDFEKQYDIWNSVIRNNLFVICKTEMAKSITRRTLVGYSTQKVNAHYFDDLVNQLKNKPEGFKEKVLKQSYWGKGNGLMKFDVVVGNPPYQLETTDDGNGKDPIYHLFIDMAQELSDCNTLIHPARFLFNAGKTPKEWNKKILSNEHFKVVKYFDDCKDVFPTVEIKGGVAITLFNKSQSYEPISLFMRNPEMKPILEKINEVGFEPLSVLVYPNHSYRFTEKLYEENPWAEGKLSKENRYNVTTNAFKAFNDLFFDELPDNNTYIKFLGKENNSSRTIKYISDKYIKVPDNYSYYKVLIARANGNGDFGEKLVKPMVGEKCIGHTDTFLSIGKFDNIDEANNLLKYLKTKFLRSLLGTLKVTQDNFAEKWLNIPMQDFTNNSDLDWDQSISNIDKQLYEKYQLSKEDMIFIEDNVQPME